ncbi:MAG: hypothetical protein J0I48_14320 [Devosia sp.]|uniref:hypothetical protein n=1 Tax=Devosia sp. 66-22 TaxID=1895753 RepID=UPI0009261420|nr:hypothetical protein [Devosia sp. 66-22]MBN9347354.1 hypothetical protein [Devosia sp.]OJX52364.1 MAG: hypothetical protein BGO81_09210 [Devosia sp. 66-22]
MKHAAAIVLCLAASPAFAEAVTYQGTIGDEPVFVEFSEPPHAGNADIFGRYFYPEQGIDIPLHAAPAARSRFGLVEEVACSEEKKNCPHAQDETPSDPPLGAKWQLEVADDGRTIEGEFSLGGRNLPVALERIGTRDFDSAEGLQGLSGFASSLFYSGAVLTLETSPYDYAKMALFALDGGDALEATGGRYNYRTDIRTKFGFPRIIELAGGSDDRPANRYLEQRHWMMSLDALWCVAQQYQGFGWNGYNYDAGTLGYWDEEHIEVHYLSPTVMTWTESGSLSCGGAHPYNHYEYMNLDVTTGVPLDLSRIFKGWVARDFDGNLVDLEAARANPRDYQWGPDEELLAFVNANRFTNEELGFTGAEGDCPIDELIPQYLAISFKGSDVVHFGMDGLPHVAVACASDLYDAQIADLAALLTPEAADYFPSLRE